MSRDADALAIGLGVGHVASSGGIAPVDFDSLTNTIARWDFTDLSTMWEDTGATTQATLGSAIARVDDLGPNGFNITQGTEADKPAAWSVADGTGIGLIFDGSSTYLDADVVTASAGDMVIFAVLETSAAAKYVFDTLSGRFLITSSHANGAYYDGAWKGTNLGATSLTQIAWRLVSTGATIYVNGATSQTSLTYTQNAIGTSSSVGGDYTGTGSLFNGIMRHLMIHGGDLTDAQMNSVGNYYAALHGLPFTAI